MTFGRWRRLPQISPQADTQEALIEMVHTWVEAIRAATPTLSGRRDVSDGAPDDALARQLEEVLHPIKGVDSRRLVRELANATSAGDAIVFNDELKARYGRSSGTAFAGIVAGPNKLMRRIAHRDLIAWDAAANGYRIHPADAEVILAVWRTDPRPVLRRECPWRCLPAFPRANPHLSLLGQRPVRHRR
jgi:hypothetical protein